MCPEKTFRPEGLRLLVNPLQKVPLAFGDVPRKNVPARGPSAFGQSPAKRSASLRRYAPKKRSGQRAFGFWPIPRKKSLQPSKMCPEKRSHQAAFGFWSILFGKSLQRPAAMPRKSAKLDSLRLLVHPLQKVSPAFRNVPRKNVHTRQSSAFGQSPAKSLSSVRRCTPKKRSRQAASGCLSTPTARLPK